MGLGKNLPNLVTIARMACCPAIFILALDQSLEAKVWAAALFLFAGMSDLWDGYIARKYGWITDTGKLLDPLAESCYSWPHLSPFISYPTGEQECRLYLIGEHFLCGLWY